jgi:menaquinone-dependent protoporphyrinogen oxidase
MKTHDARGECRGGKAAVSPPQQRMNESAPSRTTPAPFVLYATRDGHSRTVAARIAERLAVDRMPATVGDLAEAIPSPMDLAAAPLVVLVAAVRYGRHLPEAGRLLAALAKLSPPPPLALASVNLTARKPDKATAETNPYLRKLISASPVRPALAIAVAGRLDYPCYRWWDRQIIRLIMWLTDGPTDPNTCVVYTSWRAVDDFADRLVELTSHAPPAR